MTRTAPVSTIGPIERTALEWQVTLWSGAATPAEHQAFEHWLAADLAHREAWRRVRGIDQEIAAVPGAFAAPAVRAGLARRGLASRRTVLRGLGLLAGGAVSAYLLQGTQPWERLLADYSTARGAYRDLTLPDGTQLALNTASAIDLAFTAQERRLILRTGEVLVTTAPDPAPAPRPFMAQTQEGSVRALGTRFLLRRLEDTSPAHTCVQVFDGAIEIMPSAAPAPLRLMAGQQTRFSRYRMHAPTAADPRAAAWQQGLLVAERLRLADFLAEISRYRTGILRCDPAVADVLVSGVYPVHDTDLVLESLARVLPIRVHKATPYWVKVSAL
ncbi:FecR domain-containing protein [Castellaniella hirudinis]|uniref:FecR domain-containing protein n=1 Tax=Castellaniella hirudinis TaxID=1144617 RepID=UPI0039C2305F